MPVLGQAFAKPINWLFYILQTTMSRALCMFWTRYLGLRIKK